MYTVLDLETTGLDYAQDQAIQVGAIKLDKDLNVVGEYSAFIKLREGMRLSEFIVNYTGITEEMLEFGEDEDDVFAYLKEFIGDDIVVAQSATFDLGFVPFGHDVNFLCTKTVFMTLHPELDNGLKHIVAHYNIPPLQAHNALDDARMTADVLKHLDEETFLEPFINVMRKPKDRDLRFIPKRAWVVYEN